MNQAQYDAAYIALSEECERALKAAQTNDEERIVEARFERQMNRLDAAFLGL